MTFYPLILGLVWDRLKWGLAGTIQFTFIPGHGIYSQVDKYMIGCRKTDCRNWHVLFFLNSTCIFFVIFCISKILKKKTKKYAFISIISIKTNGNLLKEYKEILIFPQKFDHTIYPSFSILCPSFECKIYFTVPIFRKTITFKSSQGPWTLFHLKIYEEPKNWI